MTNPDYVTNIENSDYVIKSIPKYNLTKELMKRNIDLLVSKLHKIFQR